MTVVVRATMAQSSSSNCPNNSVEAVQYVDVLIVGGGMSGISSYRTIKMLANNLSVVILEANDRIGGRMKHQQFGTYNNITIELGANWLAESDDYSAL